MALFEQTGRMKEPFAYQEKDGRHVRVHARYEFLSGGRFRFAVGRYDRSLPLIIDPVITFATYFGGVGGGTGESVAIDPQGYVYITGVANSTTLPLKDPAQDFFRRRSHT